MTHIIIGRDEQQQELAVLSLISKYLQKDLTLDDLNHNPDIYMVKPEGLSISIDQVKEIQSRMIFKPFIEKFQICIIYKSQLLTTEAQNAFLKTLEDSPDHSIYILLLNEERNILDTILSRGIRTYLNEREQNETKKNLEILEVDLVSQFEKISQMTELSTSEILEFLEQVQRHFREKLRNSITKENIEDIKYFQKVLEHINTAVVRINANGNKRLVLENLMLQIKR